jgi:hypothetical protein
MQDSSNFEMSLFHESVKYVDAQIRTGRALGLWPLAGLHIANRRHTCCADPAPLA